MNTIRFGKSEQYGRMQIERYERQLSMRDSYNYGKVDETISRIDKKLEDLCKELKSLNTILENCNER